MAVTGKENDNGVVEFQFYRPENTTKWQSFRKAIYDRTTNQYLGRTPKNWGQLLLFYSIFYAILAALFAICMQGLFASLDDQEPKWQLGNSLIGENPGLGFRPISEKTEEGSLIWYNITNKTTVTKWYHLMEKFLKDYKLNQTGANYVQCDFDRPPPEGKVCVTTVNQLGNCGPERGYGYGTSSPCVFLKLNRIYGWKPIYYLTPDEKMPEELKNYINTINETKSSREREQVWISCNGLHDVDKEMIGGFNYYPHGFAGYYYPYKNVPNYLSPIIAVEVLNVRPNIIISIECRAWAQNIRYSNSSLDRAGSVTFEIQVDTEAPDEQPKNLTTKVVLPQNQTGLL